MDTAALNDALAGLRPVLFKLARLQLRNDTWAEDVVSETLIAALEAALVVRGVPAESRPFHPHVTLARARDPRGAGDLASVLGEGPAFGEVRVGTLHLMRSDLDPRGSRYTILAEAPLNDPSGPD